MGGNKKEQRHEDNKSRSCEFNKEKSFKRKIFNLRKNTSPSTGAPRANYPSPRREKPFLRWLKLMVARDEQKLQKGRVRLFNSHFRS
jgi:hypothetical protein